MKRREFISLVGGAAAAWPLAVHAQQPSTHPLIGFLSNGSKTSTEQIRNGFLEGMRELGYVDGRDYVFEARFAAGDIGRISSLAEELVRLKPTVIVASSTPSAQAARQATTTIPIVGIDLTDPVGLGLVSSEAHPGTNVTGILVRVEGLAAKQLQIAQDIVPGATKIGIMINPDNPSNMTQRHEIEAAAANLGMSLLPVEVHSGDEIGPAFQRFSSERADIIVVLSDGVFLTSRRRIAALALVLRLPTLYSDRQNVDDGGLVSYGVNLPASHRRAAYYVNRILKGDLPADLPVEFPTKLELVVNLKTAKALGLEVPANLLALADEVIE